MYGRTRYIVIGLVVVLVILLGLLLFRGGKKSDTTKKDNSSTTTPAPKNISEYNTPSSFVRLTIDGQVNADQTHRMIRITVAQDQNNLDIFQGYQYTSLSNSNFSSNKDAYNDFLFALQNGNFDKDRSTKQPNPAGMCPLGSRYIFEVFNDGKQVSNRWSASCGNMGTFGGKTGLMLSLFKAQIPDYAKLTRGVVL